MMLKKYTHIWHLLIISQKRYIDLPGLFEHAPVPSSLFEDYEGTKSNFKFQKMF